MFLLPLLLHLHSLPLGLVLELRLSLLVNLFGFLGKILLAFLLFLGLLFVLCLLFLHYILGLLYSPIFLKWHLQILQFLNYLLLLVVQRIILLGNSCFDLKMVLFLFQFQELLVFLHKVLLNLFFLLYMHHLLLFLHLGFS